MMRLLCVQEIPSHLRPDSMKKTIASVLFILFGLISACTTKPPPDLIPKDTFIKAMADLELNMAYYRATKDSVKADSIREEIFNQYSITEAQYLQTRAYYQRTGQQHDIIKKSLDLLNEEKDKVHDFIKQKTDSTYKPRKFDSRDSTRKFETTSGYPPN